MQKKTPGIVTLITDFGLQGEYVGAIKGAILKVNPGCQVVDITHQIEPQNILQASWVLKNSYSYYPSGTVHMVVVDPGVGTRRRPVLLKKEGFYFVGPDNGVFTFICSAQGKVEGYEMNRREFFLLPMSDTFHGRDIFAPIAGHLSLGRDAEQFGPRAKNFIHAEIPQPVLKGEKLAGQILWSDSFGNLMTNISQQEYGPFLQNGAIKISGKGWQIRQLLRTYGQGKPGQIMALFGSSGLLEIAVNCGSARNILGLKPGDPVRIKISISPRRKR